MKTRQITWCLFGLLNLLVVPAKAELQILSQARSVSAENSEGASSSASASSSDPFHGTATVSWEYTGPQYGDNEGRLYSAEAGQDSALLPYGITAQGYAHDHPPFYHYVDYGQSSRSDFHVVFATDAAYEFLLTGRLQAWGDYGGTDYGFYGAKVELSNQTGMVFSGSAAPSLTPTYGAPLDLHERLTMEAGVYTLDIRASAEGRGGPYGTWPWGGGPAPGCGGSGLAEYDVRLVAIPAPAVLPLALWGLGAVAFLTRRKILP